MPIAAHRASAVQYLAMSFAALSLQAAAIGLGHMLLAAQRGLICGASSAGSAHCWACYAAPALALAAVFTWRLGQRAVELVRASG